MKRKSCRWQRVGTSWARCPLWCRRRVLHIEWVCTEGRLWPLWSITLLTFAQFRIQFHIYYHCYFGICYIGLFFRDAITLTCELRSLGVGGPRDVGGCPRVARKFSRLFPTFKIAITVIAILNVGNRLLWRGGFRPEVKGPIGKTSFFA